MEIKLGLFERHWFNDVANGVDEDYCIKSSMVFGAEKLIGNHLALVCPMIDSCLREIGARMLSKLCRGQNIGLAPPVTLFIPWQIMRYLVCLCKNYGAEVECVLPKSKNKKIIIF